MWSTVSQTFEELLLRVELSISNLQKIPSKNTQARFDGRILSALAIGRRGHLYSRCICGSLHYYMYCSEYSVHGIGPTGSKRENDQDPDHWQLCFHRHIHSRSNTENHRHGTSQVFERRMECVRFDHCHAEFGGTRSGQYQRSECFTFLSIGEHL